MLLVCDKLNDSLLVDLAFCYEKKNNVLTILSYTLQLSFILDVSNDKSTKYHGYFEKFDFRTFNNIFNIYQWSKDYKVTNILFENVQSILNCTLYLFEEKDAPDHDFNIELIDDDSLFDNNKDDDENVDDDYSRNDDSPDADYNERKNENIIRHQFSLEYMKNVV